MPRTFRARTRRLGRERGADAERAGQPLERSDEAGGVEAYARACREEAAERLILTALVRRRAPPE